MIEQRLIFKQKGQRKWTTFGRLWTKMDTVHERPRTSMADWPTFFV